MNWTEFDLDLPQGILVYQGNNREIPLKAWVAKIDISDDDISISEIWNGEYYNDLRDKHLKKQRKQVEPCIRCISV